VVGFEIAGTTVYDMSTIDEALASAAVKFVPWAPSWEEGIEMDGVIHSPSSFSGTTQQHFTETERELLQRGVDRIVGAKDFRAVEQKNRCDVLVDPTGAHGTFHGVVRRIHGPTDLILLQRERDGGVLLKAEKQLAIPSKILWRITSPDCQLGDCSVFANTKHSMFYLVRDGLEEVAVCYRRPPAASQFRCFDVVVPALQRDTGRRVPIRFDGHDSYLLAQATADAPAQDCVKLTVRDPQLREGRLVLLFNGRVKKRSGRNFIVIEPGQPGREILLCGKTAVKQFVFDLNWPLSILQGFGIDLTLFSKPKPN
jgi:hypothetical protein